MSAKATRRRIRISPPQISVVMPVHNALPYLDEAVESILGQTFADLEFVILDDASTDGSTARLREWAAKDGRIKIIEVKRNLGPALSSDRVARAASAPIVARMDADDVSHPDRLGEQLELLRQHADVGVVGSLCDLIDFNGRKIRGPELWRLARSSWSVPFAHGTLMYRRSIFERVGGYRPEAEFWEDQDLVARMAAVTRVLVIPRPLYQVRLSETSIRSSSDQQRQEKALDRMYQFGARDECDPGRSENGADNRVDPRAFVALGSVNLWSGGRPRLFRRLIGRGRLSLDLQSLRALVWTAWASASPQSLRWFLKRLLAIRNFLATRALASGEPVSWSPAQRLSRMRQLLLPHRIGRG